MASEVVLTQLTKALEDLAKKNVAQRPPPLNLQGDKANNWRIFKQLLEVSIKSVSSEDKISWLYSSIGPEALLLLEGFEFENEEDKLNFQIVVDKFEEYCIGITNETYERWLFNCMVQSDNDFDKFKNEVTRQANKCNFSTLKQSLIRDRIVVGVRDSALRKKLLAIRKLTLQTATDLCRAAEDAGKRFQKIDQGASADSVHHVSNRNNYRSTANNDQRSSHAQPRREQSCQHCGGYGHRNDQSCPAEKARCNICQGFNHFSRVCPSSKDRGRNQQRLRINQMDDQSRSGEEQVLQETTEEYNDYNDYTLYLEEEGPDQTEKNTEMCTLETIDNILSRHTKQSLSTRRRRRE
jgi:hypothetical protein